jgi:hypothetical protein
MRRALIGLVCLGLLAGGCAQLKAGAARGGKALAGAARTEAQTVLDSVAAAAVLKAATVGAGAQGVAVGMALRILARAIRG